MKTLNQQRRDAADAVSPEWRAADYENYKEHVGDYNKNDDLLSDYQMYENLKAGKKRTATAKTVCLTEHQRKYSDRNGTVLIIS